MLLMGDEVRRTQGGNNNAYCHDDPTAGSTGRAVERHADILRFTKGLIRMRRRLATLLDVPDETSLLDLLANASLEWSGVRVGQPDSRESSRSVALTLRAGPGALHIIFNAYWEPLDFELRRARRHARRMAPHRGHDPGHTGRSRPDVHRGDAGHDAVLPRRGALDRDHGRPTSARTPRRRIRVDDRGAERARMADAGHPEDGWREASPWYQWGPYLSERAWGSVREDYSADGDAWNSFPHDHARSRVYRWNEDGMAGLSDVFGRLCLGLSLWNGVDPILKERMFGLTNQEGNHGEDSKDYWWYLDALPSGAWLRWRYHYPQAPFPYEDLIEENARRSKFESRVRAARHRRLRRRPLLDRRGPLREGRPDRHPDAGRRAQPGSGGSDAPRPPDPLVPQRVVLRSGHRQADDAGRRRRATDPRQARRSSATTRSRSGRAGRHGTDPVVLRERNERGSLLRDDRRPPRIPRTASTTTSCMTRTPSIPAHRDESRPLVRPDGAGRRIGRGQAAAPPDRRTGLIDGQGRGDNGSNAKRSDLLGKPFDALMREREAEADEFYEDLRRDGGTDEEQLVMRQAFAGMLWSKQYYGYDVARWLDGDPGQPAPPYERHTARNAAWRHFDSADILSMPDPWEYPWFAAWDLAFHAVTLAHIDPAFAKYQLLLLCREWFQHPDGALPAYEWSFDDVNPPVHAAAALLVFDIDGRTDLTFLKRIFHKLLMNFTWWLNREDREGNDLFSGGFLGLDNIGAFDRSHLPAGTELEQSDATAWMFFYCLSMLRIATVLAETRPGVRGPDVELPRTCRPDLGGDEPERHVGRDRRLLLRRAQARRRLDRADQGPFDGRAHPAPPVGGHPGPDGRPGSGVRQTLRRSSSEG